MVVVTPLDPPVNTDAMLAMTPVPLEDAAVEEAAGTLAVDVVAPTPVVAVLLATVVEAAGAATVEVVAREVEAALEDEGLAAELEAWVVVVTTTAVEECAEVPEVLVVPALTVLVVPLLAVLALLEEVLEHDPSALRMPRQTETAPRFAFTCTPLEVETDKTEPVPADDAVVVVFVVDAALLVVVVLEPELPRLTGARRGRRASPSDP